MSQKSERFFALLRMTDKTRKKGNHRLSMGKGIFITGTDTGVGKTVFACGLAALLKNPATRSG